MDRMSRRVLLIAFALLALTSSLGAQSDSTAASDRKISSRVAPSYPELAKKMHIHGMVKLEAIVRTNGSVKSTRVLGGNPVLLNAAVEAVGKWRFEPATSETTERVQVLFEMQ